MVANSTGGYGTYNPNAIDPFPIESTLAEIVGKNNVGNAANLLSQYQSQRADSQGNYDYAMGQQHDFARQQLAAQMHENNIKALTEGAKTPGLIDLFNSPQYADILAGIDPNVRQRISTNLRDLQVAEQAQKGGDAAFKFTEAGAQPNTQQMSQLSGGLAGPAGTPLSTQNQILANNARLAAARIRASADKPGTITVSSDMPGTAEGQVIHVSRSKVAPEDQGAEQDRQQAEADKLRARRSGVTNLPNAPATGGQTSAQPAQLDTNSPRGKVAQQKATVWLDGVKKSADSGNPESAKIYKDVTGGMNGGTFTVIASPNGSAVIKGKTGVYPFGG